jgi:hypothetical protein
MRRSDDRKGEAAVQRRSRGYTQERKREEREKYTAEQGSFSLTFGRRARLQFAAI